MQRLGCDGNSPSLIAIAINLKQNLLLVIEQLFSSFALPPLPLFTAYLFASIIHYSS